MGKYISKKFNIEICVNEEASGYEDRLPWVSYGTIVAEGDTLTELFETATVDLIDQDGGERGQVNCDKGWMQELIQTEFLKQAAALQAKEDQTQAEEAAAERLGLASDLNKLNDRE